MKKIFTVFLLTALLSCPALAAELQSPSLDTNPSMDVIVTRTTPLLSFKKNGEDIYRFEIQLDQKKSFESSALRKYELVPIKGKVSALQIPQNAPLQDNCRWWWRVRAVNKDGSTSQWAMSRFYVDSGSDDDYSGLQRVIPVSVKTSSGSNPEFLTDYSDAGLNSQWRASPPGPDSEWIELDLGEPTTISRAWLLAQSNDSDGWPTDFHWLISNDGENWETVQGANIDNCASYRIIQDFPAQTARFWRLNITRYRGYAPALNEIMLFTPAQPQIPNIPEAPYILVIGNQRNGFTFTRLTQRICEIKPEIKIVQIPYWKANMAMIRALPNRPAAIILSGNNADYSKLPMFEYNGEYNIIRKADIPILGICAGCQMNALAYGYTRAHSMGWADISAMQDPQHRTKITKLINAPILDGTPAPFTAPEVHSWAIYSLPDSYEVLAASSYIQVIRRKDKMRYGVQFHPEIKASYNQAVSVLENFLESALAKSGE